MDQVSPSGPVYQAGTLSGNPLAMAAGIAMLRYLKEHPEIYRQLATVTAGLRNGFEANAHKYGKNYTVNQVGSMISLFFTEDRVVDFSSARKSDTDAFCPLLQCHA
jgi:glutamate-1-semialdehyde 2,1-aminomutase